MIDHDLTAQQRCAQPAHAPRPVALPPCHPDITERHDRSNSIPASAISDPRTDAPGPPHASPPSDRAGVAPVREQYGASAGEMRRAMHACNLNTSQSVTISHLSDTLTRIFACPRIHGPLPLCFLLPPSRSPHYLASALFPPPRLRPLPATPAP